MLLLTGELDMATAPALVARAEALLSEGRALVLDLRELSFVDSTGLGAIAEVERRARTTGATLALVPGPRNVQRVFDVSGTTRTFTWTDPP